MKLYTSKGRGLCAFALIMAVCFSSFQAAYAQMSVSPNKTATQLANALVGGGVTITNATLTCPSLANGTFTNTASALNISGGILLTSGLAGPATQTAANFESNNNNTGGDPDLTTLSGNTTYDACVLEFDFSATGDSIQFNYQFASEEYPSYTCTQYNDVFGFFISGNQYVTPTNIALVPGTSIPVAINSINGGLAGADGPTTNCTGMGAGSPFTQYFINNINGPAPVYDGLTTVLTAKAAVTPCSTYHLKLGVVDASDHILDSGVFIEEGSLTVLPPVIVGCPSNISINSTAACTQTATWTPPTVAGNCLGVTEVSNYHPGDVFPVGTTTVTYAFTNAGGTSYCSFDVTVTDVSTCTISVTPSSSVCTNGSVTDIYLGYGPQSATLTATVNGGATGFSYSWSPATGLSATNIANPVFTPTAAGTYTFTVTATHPNGCQTTCSVTFCVKDIRVPGTNGGKVYLCHHPTDNPGNPQTIAISVNAVPTHVCAHGGDKLGKCDDLCGGGARALAAVVADKPLEILASPNPFVTDMNFRILSNEFDYADMAVYDVTGRLIQKQANVPVGTDIRIGDKLSIGSYIIEVKHGELTERMKIIKIQ